MTAADLKYSEKGLIQDIDFNHIPLKLIELGCLPGTEIKFIRHSPFNDPICIEIGGTKLAILKEVAKLIKIQKIDSD